MLYYAVIMIDPETSSFKIAHICKHTTGYLAQIGYLSRYLQLENADITIVQNLYSFSLSYVANNKNFKQVFLDKKQY